MPLEGQPVLVGPNRIPAIVIHDRGSSVQVRILGDDGLIWVPKAVIFMVIEGATS